MICRQGNGDPATRNNGSVDNGGPIVDPADTDQSDLRPIDNPMHNLDASVAQIGDGHRWVGHLRCSQSPGAGAVDKVSKCGHKFRHGQLIGAANGRGDESATPQRYCDPPGGHRRQLGSHQRSKTR